MDSEVKIYINRALNELSLAEVAFSISNSRKLKEILQIDEEKTYYSGVISHSYYCIFYTAKAILLTKGIKTEAPKIHKKTFDAFKNEFVETGILDVRLLEIYKEMVVRADALLEIFKDEKWKRGHFTYHTISEANREPAEQSIKRAKMFVTNIRNVLNV